MSGDLYQSTLRYGAAFEESSSDGVTPRRHWANLMEWLRETGPEELGQRWARAERRIRGYKRALAGARIRFDDDLLVPGEYSLKTGRDAVRAWLRRHVGQPLPHAIFCASDEVAIGCLEALAEVGLRVPDDISVAGFDDTLAARTTVPQLTTVRQPLRAMGHRAVEVLLVRIAEQNGESVPVPIKPVIFPVDLVPRASVGAPPVAQRIVPPPRRKHA